MLDLISAEKGRRRGAAFSFSAQQVEPDTAVHFAEKLPEIVIVLAGMLISLAVTEARLPESVPVDEAVILTVPLVRTNERSALLPPSKEKAPENWVAPVPIE